MSYWNFLVPTIPAITGPEWIPILISKNSDPSTILSVPLPIIATFSFNSISLAQEGWVFPTDCEPEIITAEDAAAAAKDLIDVCGFGSVYFHEKDLEELLSVKNCAGLRFYIAMERPDQRFTDVIAVAINEKGKEIGDFLERKYHMAKALDAFYPHDFEKMGNSKAKKYVDNLINGDSKLEPYVGYLGIERIEALLATEKANGIRIYPP